MKSSGLPGPTRRDLLTGGAAMAVAHLAGGVGALAAVARPRSVAVVGAGAFGGWSALALQRKGFRVTLLDAWGPGNSRSSSGGETRVIRAVYGDDALYPRWVARSFALWAELENSRRTRFFHPTGALWLFDGDDSYGRAARKHVEAAGFSFDLLALDVARSRYPQIDFTGVASVMFETRAGYLLARRSCAAVVDELVAAGGDYRELAVRPGPVVGGRMALALSDGTRLEPDAVVFACGPWLGKLFPELLGEAIVPTRQEVFFFGTPAGDNRFAEERMPVWVEFGERLFYGLPGNEQRGFKVADDTRGDEIDPDTLERLPTAVAVERAKAFVARRFPALAGAPIVETRVCQYENSPDGALILDRHPEAANVWLAGGGSGHGFKLGPAVGEQVAAMVAGESEPLAKFALARFAGGTKRRTTQMEEKPG